LLSSPQGFDSESQAEDKALKMNLN